MLSGKTVKVSLALLLMLLALGIVGGDGRRLAAASEPGSWEPIAAPAGFTTPGAEWIRIHGAGGRSYTTAVFRPSGKGPFPLVLVLHGNGGLRPSHVDLAAELSRAGFMAVAGCWAVPGVPNPPICAEATPRANLLADATLAAKEWIAGAKQLPGAGSRYALFGSSLGGWGALWAAGTGVSPEAIVLDAPAHCPCTMGPPPWLRDTRDALGGLNAPVLLFHANGDPQVPVTQSREYEALARAAGKAVTVVYSEGVRHPAVLQPVAGVANPSAQAEGLRRAIAFLKAALLTPVTVTGSATGAEVVPPVGGSAGASVRLTFNSETNDLGYSVTVSGLSGAQVTGVQVQRGARGSNGPVLHSLPVGAASTFSGWVRLSASEAADLRAGNLYLNLLSQASPNGFARLQLIPTSTTPAITPPNTGDGGLR